MGEMEIRESGKGGLGTRCGCEYDPGAVVVY